MYYKDDEQHLGAGVDRPARILVVDDDSSIRLMAQEVLGRSEFDVTVVANGRDGLAQVAASRPDIVLLDVLMPEFDGFSTLRRIRESDLGRDCSVVMITDLHDSGAVKRAYELGATDFITKPINWELLQHRLRYMLRSVRRDSVADGESPRDVPTDPSSSAVRILEAAVRLASSRLDDEQMADVVTIRDAARHLLNPGPPATSESHDEIATGGDVLNRSRIDQLRGFTRSDGSSLLRRVIGLFEEESRELLARLEHSIEASLADEVRQAAHELKSVSGNVGADSLHAHCNDLEQLGRESRLEEADQIFEAIQFEHARASEALQRELDNVSAP